jgi:hypothetical protein
MRQCVGLSGFKVIIREQVILEEPAWDATFGNVGFGCDDKNLDVMSDKIIGFECNMEGWLWLQ